jgi:hypothetical protein
MCKSCEASTINGILCHETGCPDSWQDERRTCKWCGTTFKPENRYQDCCCHTCMIAFNNLDCNCLECNPEEESTTDPYGFHYTEEKE